MRWDEEIHATYLAVRPAITSSPSSSGRTKVRAHTTTSVLGYAIHSLRGTARSGDPAAADELPSAVLSVRPGAAQ